MAGGLRAKGVVTGDKIADSYHLLLHFQMRSQALLEPTVVLACFPRFDFRKRQDVVTYLKGSC